MSKSTPPLKINHKLAQDLLEIRDALDELIRRGCPVEKLRPPVEYVINEEEKAR